MGFTKNLNAKLDACAGNVLILEQDEYRVETKVRMVGRSRGFDIWTWKVSEGLKQLDVRSNANRQGNRPNVADPLALVKSLLDWTDGPSVVIAYDVTTLMNRLPTAPMIARSLRDLNTKTQTENDPVKMVQLVVVDREEPQLDGAFQRVNLELPDREELGTILDGVLGTVEEEVQQKASDNRDRIINALRGLPAFQATNALAESIARVGAIDPDTVRNYKKELIQANALEWTDPDPRGFDSIGGMDELKRWFRLRSVAFDEDLAAEYDLPSPKGVQVVGVPGTGKSQLAKALAAELGFSLVRFNVGSAYGKYQGESESSFENAIKTAEAVAPCILFIDEGEKMFAGANSSGETDSGTSQRMFGSFLNWLQEKQSQVFVFMTVNDPTKLPAEFTRAGRFDGTWWIDVPTLVEREAIVNVFRKRYRKATSVDTDAIANASEEYTGAEIENAFKEALYRALADRRDVTTDDVLDCLAKTNKVIKAWADKIENLREWARNGAQMANAPEEKTSQPAQRTRRVRVGRR